MDILSAIARNDIAGLVRVLSVSRDLDQADEVGWTPLFETVAQSRYLMTELLLALGANSGMKDHLGYRPIDYAMARDDSEMVSILRGVSQSDEQGVES